MIKIQDNITLEISKDGLEAYISILKSEDKSIEYVPNEVINEIKKHIKFGLNENVLKDINEDNVGFEKICIAKGEKPVHGKNGRIKCYFEPIIKLVPKLKEDGTVDYRELNSVNNIFKDDVLAEIIPPIDGINGMKVTGEEIPHNKGKFPKFKKGKNTYISDDGLYLKSKINGIIEMKNGSIKVSQILVVDNIDSSTGNIDFTGSVTVNNDILNDFKLKAVGTIEVKGSLEGGYIETESDVLIRQGIQGFNKLAINTEGSLGTKFIENAIVNVKGNITAEAIMHSNINCKSNILLVGRKGLIVGGICRVNQELRAKIIGSNMATQTIIEVGVAPDMRDKYLKIEKEVESNKDKLKKINQSIKILEVFKKSNKLDQTKEKLYEDLLRAEKTINLKNKILENEFTNLNKKIEGMSKGQVKVADTIYPGVKIVIGKSTFFVREEMKRCTFYKEDGEIRVGPY